MTKSLKSLLLSLLLVVTAASGIAGVSAVAKADTAVPEITQSDIYMKNGASIRAEKTDDAGYGIRFMGTINEIAYQALVTAYGEDNVECGILICPKSYLVSGVTLDFDETDNLKHYVDGETTIESGVKYFQSRKATDLTLSSDETTLSFRCSLVDIKATNLDREFAAAAYVGYRANSESAFTYVVSAPTSRNIYTVASYALNDETASLSDDASNYLNNEVVAEVNKTYTKTNVELVSEAEGAAQKLFATGESFTLNATVQTADGSKSLEAGVSLASDSGASKVSGNTFTVTARGDLNLNVNFNGFSSANTSLSGYKCDTKTIEIGGLKDYNGKLSFGKSTDVSHPEGKEVYKYDTDSALCGIFTAEDLASLKTGDYISVDVYGVDSPLVALRYHTDKMHVEVLYDNASSTPIGTIEGVCDWSTYNMDGTAASKSINADAWAGKWVRLQVKLTCDVSDLSSLGFVLYDNDWHKLSKGLYLSNLLVKTYSEGYTSDVSLGDFDEEASHAFGDEVALTVRAKTNRGTYKNVNAACTVKSGNGSVADNKFIVGLGDSTLQFTFGDITKEITVKGADSMPVSNDNVVLIDSGVAALEDVDEYTDKNGVKVENVLKWYVQDEQTGLSNTRGIGFSTALNSEYKKDRYVYMKVLFTKQNTFMIGGTVAYYVYNGSYSASTKLNSGNGWGEGIYELYKANGIPCGESTVWGSDTLINQWLILEYKLDDDGWGTGSTWRYFGWINENFCTSTNPAYIGDIEVTLEPKDFSTAYISNDGVTDIAKYAYTYDETQTTFSEIASSDIAAVQGKIDGGSKVYAWAPAANRVGDFNANNGGITFGVSRFLTKDTYLYFDFYVTEKCTLSIFDGNTTSYIYNSQKSADGSATEWQVYDAEGNALTSGTIWDGKLESQWVTVEFKLAADWDSNDAITRYTNAAQDSTFYLSNIKISQTKLMGDTAE